MESAKVGKRGAIVVPAKLRRRFGIEEGTVVIAEEREDGILIRPAVVVPIERYTPERKAEFLLSNATTRADYRKARKEVQKLGIDIDDRAARSFAEVMGVAFVGTAGMLFHGFVRKHLTLAELEDAVEELSKTIWLAPAVVAEVLKKAREAER